jgi:hypothetical protein
MFILIAALYDPSILIVREKGNNPNQMTSGNQALTCDFDALVSVT